MDTKHDRPKPHPQETSIQPYVPTQASQEIREASFAITDKYIRQTQAEGFPIEVGLNEFMEKVFSDLSAKAHAQGRSFIVQNPP